MVERRVTGFGNRSNDCFLNTAFHLLLCIPELLTIPTSKPGFIQALKESFTVKTGEMLVKPLTAVEVCVRNFTGTEESTQCDLYEFLVYMLGGIKLEMETVLQLNSLLGLEMEVGNTRIHPLIVTLDVDSTLEIGLNRYFSQGHCQFSLHKTSRYLLIAFKRLKTVSNRPFKRTEFVRFPSSLKFPCVQSNTGSIPSYSLLFVGIHHGKDCTSGHYTACLLSPDSEATWVHVNDAVVRRVTWSWVRRQQAYCLLYRLKGCK